jgi:RimJ/RimL family protein N-acetyltransferase
MSANTAPNALQLHIEPLCEAHADELFEAFADERIYPYIPQRAHPSRDSMRREYREFSQGAAPDSGEVWMNWVIKDADSRKCLGTLQATVFAEGSLWIGYTVAPRVWGLGIGTQAVRWLLLELSTRFPGKPILASVDIRNLSSIRVLEKTGFTLLRQEAAEIRGQATEDFIYQFLPTNK